MSPGNEHGKTHPAHQRRCQQHSTVRLTLSFGVNTVSWSQNRALEPTLHHRSEQCVADVIDCNSKRNREQCLDDITSLYENVEERAYQEKY